VGGGNSAGISWRWLSAKETAVEDLSGGTLVLGRGGGVPEQLLIGLVQGQASWAVAPVLWGMPRGSITGEKGKTI